MTLLARRMTSGKPCVFGFLRSPLKQQRSIGLDMTAGLTGPNAPPVLGALNEGRGVRAARSLARTVLGVCVVWLIVYEAHVVALPGWHTFFFGRAVHLVALGLASGTCLLRAASDERERAGWLLIGLGCASWTAGEIYFTAALWDLHQIPVPSWADVGYLGFPPLVFGGIMLLARSRARHMSATAWIDAAAAALAVAGVSAAVVFDVVLHSVGGTAAEVGTNLAYPVTDLLLIGVLVGVTGLCGWRLTRTWALLGTGVVIFWVADSLYLIQSANSSYVPGGVYDVGWWGGITFLAIAAWTRRGAAVPRRAAAETKTIVAPLAFGVLGLGVLIYGSLRTNPMNGLAVALASASIAAIGVRLYLTFRQNQRMLRASREHALIDSLTNLSNRRALIADLEAALTKAEYSQPVVLGLFDLDGFKSYNDEFGHLAGDDLLRRLSARLAVAVAGRGTAYRLGGDEFCVLIDPGAEVPQAILDTAVSALSDYGKGFSIGCSSGSVTLPHEAQDCGAALGLADRRMYSAKQRGRTSAGRQSADVLVRALAERVPDIEDHMNDVASLAAATAEQLGLEPDEIELVHRAAALHDIGKVAIPDAILLKPGPLDPDEWAFMRRHPVIGERILAAAPALSSVAALVRASHERFDGAGYPDGLAAHKIPLGARIIIVCDAFDAMISHRPYNRPRSGDDAERELRACAGTQFDPVVVDAFCRVRQALPQATAA
jgi:two-component system cell cycle response regulator